MKIPSFLKIILLRISPPCEEITLLISKGIDTRLSIRERWRLQLHFHLCTACKRFNIQIHTLHTIAQEVFKWEEDEPSEAIPFSLSSRNHSAHVVLPNEARKRIQTALNSALDRA